nr:hypothetical protein GCM10017745_38840 [Saccharothrix mutabilis subsp. capreolus]
MLSTVDPAAELSTTAAEVLEHVDAAVAAYPEVPIARVRVEVAGIPRTLLLKLEGRSPWRSIKGRTALGLVRSIAPRMASRDVTVVESTSGNLGVALSAICRDLGLPFVAVVDLKQSPVIQAAIEANGARLEVVRTPAAATTHLLDRLDRVRKLVAEIPGAVWPNQYENDANRHVHETWTAPEIDRQVGGEAQAVFVAVSTGGTLAGLAAHFRRARPATRLVAVDVEGSTVFGGVPGGRVLTGIGASRRSTFLTRAECDDLVYVGGGGDRRVPRAARRHRDRGRRVQRRGRRRRAGPPRRPPRADHRRVRVRRPRRELRAHGLRPRLAGAAAPHRRPRTPAVPPARGALPPRRTGHRTGEHPMTAIREIRLSEPESAQAALLALECAQRYAEPDSADFLADAAVLAHDLPGRCAGRSSAPAWTTGCTRWSCAATTSTRTRSARPRRIGGRRAPPRPAATASSWCSTPRCSATWSAGPPSRTAAW